MFNVSILFYILLLGLGIILEAMVGSITLKKVIVTVTVTFWEKLILSIENVPKKVSLDAEIA